MATTYDIRNACEIRVTRNRFYGQPGDNGDSVKADLEGRNGHYFTGATYNECIAKAVAFFPGESLTFQHWGNSVYHGEVFYVRNGEYCEV